MSDKIDPVAGEVFAGGEHLGGDSTASFEIDRDPETHYQNVAEFCVGIDALDVIVGLDETSARQLRDVLDDILEEDDDPAARVEQQRKKAAGSPEAPAWVDDE